MIEMMCYFCDDGGCLRRFYPIQALDVHLDSSLSGGCRGL